MKHGAAGAAVLTVLLLGGGRLAAQSTSDQALKNLPQQMKDNGENKVVAKGNTVSNSAADKVDSAGTHAYKSFVRLFRKKNKPATDSTNVHRADSAALPPKNH